MLVIVIDAVRLGCGWNNETNPNAVACAVPQRIRQRKSERPLSAEDSGRYRPVAHSLEHSSFVIIFTNVIEIRALDFDLEKTLDSGQVFHWQKISDGFVGAIRDLPVYMAQDNGVLRVRFGGPPKPARQRRALPGIVARYFALDHPLGEICDSFPKDPVMNAARDFCHGLRIIRQPKWECLATFICSSMKQVAYIRQILRKLRERFCQSCNIEH